MDRHIDLQNGALSNGGRLSADAQMMLHFEKGSLRMHFFAVGRRSLHVQAAAVAVWNEQTPMLIVSKLGRVALWTRGLCLLAVIGDWLCSAFGRRCW